LVPKGSKERDEPKKPHLFFPDFSVKIIPSLWVSEQGGILNKSHHIEGNIQSKEELSHKTVQLGPAFLVPWWRGWKPRTMALLC